MDELQPDRKKGGAPKSEKRQERIALVNKWLEEDPEQTHEDLIQRFKDLGI
jgi:hypothetical protein